MQTPTDPKGNSLIFLRCALESRDHAERLFKMFMRRKGISKDIDAMQAGVHALKDSVRADVRELRDRGQLLFFFTGTTVLQQAAGGAA